MLRDLPEAAGATPALDPRAAGRAASLACAAAARSMVGMVLFPSVESMSGDGRQKPQIQIRPGMATGGAWRTGKGRLKVPCQHADGGFGLHGEAPFGFSQLRDRGAMIFSENRADYGHGGRWRRLWHHSLLEASLL